MWSWLTVLGEHERIERDLAERTGQKLAEAGVGWAQSSFAGRDGRLSGVADDEHGPDRAVEIARSVWGVRLVDSQVQLGDRIEDYVWSASYGDNRVRLTGFVPNEPTRKAIVGVAKANFPKSEIVDQMKPALGVPDRDIWLGGVSFSLRQLAALRTGEAGLSPKGLSLVGEASSVAAYKAVKGELRTSLPKGIQLVQDRVAPPRISPYKWTIERSGNQLVMTGYVPGEKIRERIFALAKERFPKLAIIDRMEAASGAAADWQEVALGLLEQLSSLEEGRAEITDTTIVVEGRAVDEAVAERVRAALRSTFPASYAVTERLTFPAPVVATVEPYVTAIAATADTLVLSGHVPSEAARSDLVATIATRFPKAAVDDRMELGGGAPEGWKACVEAGLLALKRLGVASMSVTDRRLEVTGRTDDENLAEKLSGEVRAAANRACDSAVRLTLDLPPEPSLNWRATFDGQGLIVLDGEVPDAETRAELVALAGRTFAGAQVTDNLKIASVRAGKWPKVAALGVRLLGKMRRGEAVVSGHELALRGEVKDTAVASNLRDQLAREITKGYRGVDAIEVRSDAMIWAEQEAKRRAEAERLKEAEEAARKQAAEAAVRQQAEQARQAEQNEARRQQAEREAGQRRQTMAPAAEAPPAAGEDAARARAEEAERARQAESAVIKARQREEADACQAQMRDIARQGVIRFAWASATLEAESLPTLKRLAEVAGVCPLARIEIEGHTDAEGTPERNRKLSERRAQSVVDYLTAAGVDPSRLTAVGYGETRPVASNDTAEDRAKNRRIEFTVVPN